MLLAGLPLPVPAVVCCATPAAAAAQRGSAAAVQTTVLPPTALQAQAAVDDRFLGDLSQLRRRWKLRRHAGAGPGAGAGSGPAAGAWAACCCRVCCCSPRHFLSPVPPSQRSHPSALPSLPTPAGLFYADISLPLRGAVARAVSQEGAQCNIIQACRGRGGGLRQRLGAGRLAWFAAAGLCQARRKHCGGNCAIPPLPPAGHQRRRLHCGGSCTGRQAASGARLAPRPRRAGGKAAAAGVARAGPAASGRRPAAAARSGPRWSGGSGAAAGGGGGGRRAGGTVPCRGQQPGS